MLINRYNYEEFFLLYADGELPPLEVEIVEQFVQVHPDLKEELDMLMDCKLVAEMPIFPKEKIFKQTAWDEKNISHTQLQLLLLLDNELPAFDKKIIEKKITKNPVLALELNSLEQAKCLAETVAYPNKAALYKQKRIPTIAWWRWAAAAAVAIGAGMFFIGKNVGENKAGSLPIVSKSSHVLPSLKSVQSAQNVIQTNDLASTVETVMPQNAVPEKQNDNTVAITKAQEKRVQKAVETSKENEAALKEKQSEPIAKNTVLQSENRDDLNDERVSLMNHKTFTSVEDEGIAKSQKGPAKFIGSTKTNLVVKNKTDQKESLSYLQAEADDNEYVHIAGARVKKQKLRGVFRNITRGISRTFSISKVEAAPAIAVNN